MAVMSVVVAQSHPPDPPAWLRRCLASVAAWCRASGHAHRVIGDALFERVPPLLRDKVGPRGAILADLARLVWLEELLAEGFERVVWLDADVFVFGPLELPLARTHALGREVWVEDGLKVRRHVHNAAMLFGPGDPVLPFLRHAATRVLERHDGPLAPQLIGPKLVTALDGIAGFALIEQVGMASPRVIRDLVHGGPAPGLLWRDHAEPLAALNLCASLIEPAMAEAAMDRLPGIGPPDVA